MNRDHSLGFFAGLAGGIALAMAINSRYAPQLRKVAAAKSREGVNQLRDFADSATDSANDLMEKGKAAVERQHDAVTNAFEAGKKAYVNKAG